MIIEQLFANPKLTESEKQIADFIEQNPRIVINLSLEELSEKCFISQASIIRLCKKLGTKGFADFKIKLASELTSFALDNEKIQVDIPISSTSNCEDVAKTFFNLSLQTLETTFKELDYEKINTAAKLISDADLISIYGRGESLILAEDFHYKLIRIGLNSTLETLNGFQEAKCLRNESSLKKLAIVISHYCNSRQLHYIVDELISNKIPFILLTAQEKAWPFDTLATIALKISSSESRYKIGSFASRNAMLFLLDCLYGQVFALNYHENLENLTNFSQRKLERNYYYNTLKPNSD